LIGGLAVGVAAWFVTGPRVALEFAFIFGLVYALAAACFTAWYKFLIARLCLRLRGQLPWPFMAFLADMRYRGVLRQIGAVYQFRHARLQDRLTTLAGARTAQVPDNDVTTKRRSKPVA
jgi:hypothetical protein